jgi:tight adherence protein B
VKRLRAALLVLAVGGVCAATAAADTGSVSITPVARLGFPERGFLVGLPTGRQLTSSDVVVRENGQLVRNPSFVPAEKSTARLGAVLVIDTSNSMRGRPLRDALAAGRLFAEQFAHGEKVGVVTFNDKSNVVQRPTGDSTALRSALGTVPGTREGTHIYDALAEALLLLRSAHVTAGSIVLLSDGADTGSSTRETQLVTRAQRARVRIFTVGLHSRSFRPGSLQLLARATHAAYAEAKGSRDLESIYAQIGRRLASEYLLRYRSSSNAGTNVVVTLTVRRLGISTFTYSAPKVVAVSPFHRSVFVRFWGSTFSVLLVALLGAALAAGSVLALVKAPSFTIADRIGAFTSRSATEADDSEDKPRVSSRIFGSTERSLSRTKWWTRFREELAIADVKYSAEQILAAAVVGTFLFGFLLYSLAPVFSIFALLVPPGVYSLCQRVVSRVRRRFEDQLPDNLQVLASALRAGHSFVGALSVVAKDASQPSKREFTQVVADEQLGVPLERSLREVARRMANNDLEQVALVAELQHQAGGNMAEVLDRVVETIRGRSDLRRLVRTLTAQGRLARWILTFLPVGLGLVISLANPSYMAPLFNTTGGQVAIAIAISMIVTGSFVIKKIINIKV